jgi:hypothetical protein
LVSGILGLIVSIKLHSGNFLAGLEWLTYGRIRPAQLDALVYGFAAQAAFGVSEIPAGGDSAGPQIEIEPDPEAALDRALAPPPGTEPADTLLVCGSLYLVGAARGSRRRRFGGS